MIKLIASDVDGTLLPEGTAELNPELYEVILKLKEKGIVFAAASGRQENSIRTVFAPIADDIYFISNNGGYVTYQNKILVCRAFDREIAQEILAYIRKMENVFYLVTSPAGDYTDCQDKEMLEWLRDGYRIHIEQVKDVAEKADRLVKISVFVKGRDAAGEAVPAKAVFAGKAMVTAAGDHWVDFTAPGSEKGNALRELQERLHVTREETMAFGDNNNDIGMLKNAEESYAVSDAREEAKAVCRHILPDSNKNSVLRVLKTLL